MKRQEVPLSGPAGDASVELGDTAWNMDWQIEEGDAGHVGVRVSSSPAQEPGLCVNLGIAVDIGGWSAADDYLLMPGAVYAGNRFNASQQHQYPPAFEPDGAGPDAPILVSDVPRLEKDAARSSIQMLSGDLAAPMAAVWRADRREGLIVYAPGDIDGRETGWQVHEDREAARLRIVVSVPGVREDVRYTMLNRATVSRDRGAELRAGESLACGLKVARFPAADISQFMRKVFDIRAAMRDGWETNHQISFSEAFRLMEAKYNSFNWMDEVGYYAQPGGMHWASPSAFALGWTGGMITTHGLLAGGDELSRQRVMQNFDWFFREGVSPSGFFYGRFFTDGTWGSDTSNQPATRDWTLIRRQGDVLYYLAHSMDLLRRREPDWQMPDTWEAALRSVGDALVRNWRRDGQWGQFVDQNTGRITAGGSTSGASCVAGLALLSALFGEETYLTVALEAAAHFDGQWLRRGVTVGGPGDALQCPDSESVAALVEAYALLYERTGDDRWLDAGQRAVHQMATWVMPYNYTFPDETEFGRLDMRSIGTVFANAQNKHSAPGLCTFAGVGLLRLYRATGELRFLQLLRDIAQALGQCMSREDRPIHAKDGRPMPAGWINERFNTSDWDDNVGGVFYGGCWCEVSLMLSAVQLPGVYVNTRHQEIIAFDHVEVDRVEGDTGELTIRNLTGFPAEVSIFVDDQDGPLELNFMEGQPRVTLEPHATATFRPQEQQQTSRS